VVRIDPTALYSKADLEELLGGRLSVDAFLDRLRPVRRFKNLYWGQDLFDALAECPRLGEERKSPVPPIFPRKEVKRHAQGHTDPDRLSVSEVLARRG
jgi:hypothetical protein